MKRETAVILCDVRSIHNVGSIFRTAECAGASKIYLCGYTPTPQDRFGRKRKDFAKVSLGAEDSVPWESVSDAGRLIDKLKRNGYRIIAVEQAEGSVDYKRAKTKGMTAVVYGNEVGGVPKSVLRRSDVVAEIPMAGKKESLNVSVAVGVSLFRLLGR